MEIRRKLALEQRRVDQKEFRIIETARERERERINEMLGPL